MSLRNALIVSLVGHGLVFAALVYTPRSGVSLGTGPAAIEVVFESAGAVPKRAAEPAPLQEASAAESAAKEAPETPAEPEALPMASAGPPGAEQAMPIVPTSPESDLLQEAIERTQPVEEATVEPLHEREPTEKPASRVAAKPTPKPEIKPERAAESRHATRASRDETPVREAEPEIGGRAAPDETVQMAAASGGAFHPVVTTAHFRRPPEPPTYPRRAVSQFQQGTAIVRALVDIDGAAREIRLWRSSGFALLDEAALKAVRRWAFEPARLAGRAITAWVEVPVKFELR